MKKQYEDAVIERLEDTFGELENKMDLARVLISTLNNAVDDNIQDYYSELMNITEGSSLDNTENLEYICHENILIIICKKEISLY